MSEEYHTPKDLVNKQPLTIGLEVFQKNEDNIKSYGCDAFQRINDNSSSDPKSVSLKLIV